MMDVFALREHVVGEYHRYVRSFFEVRDPRIRELVDQQLQRGVFWPDPLVQLNPTFEPGPPLLELVREGLLHPECEKIFADKDVDGTVRSPFRFHKHQVDAFRAARAGKHYVLTTGTGSGKSLSYIVPIVDHVLRRGSGRGIQAIVVYPMNALANSQIGELTKFLEHGYPAGHPPVTFKRYTGQERDEERREIIGNPPDILLTNYVMLELLLTRPWEHQLVAAAEALRFLVLDELHTYRGRQGADVAMLVRRVREACRAHDLLHVGTSATLSGAGSWDAQRAEVAEVASRIFGVNVGKDEIVGETLRRVTPRRELEPEFDVHLREVIERGDTPPTDSIDAFVNHPLSVWIETNLGLEEKGGRWVRCTPRPISGDDGAGQDLADRLQLPIDFALGAIMRTLLAGYRVRDSHRRPLFAFRLHQLVSKGDAVYASPEAEADRHLTLDAQQFVPGSDRARVLLPIAFCRECGQEYYLVRKARDGQGRTSYLPRDIGDRTTDDDGEPGFLHIRALEPWPDGGTEILQRLPDSWVELDKQGQLVVRQSRRAQVPRTVFLGPDGVEGSGDVRAQWLPAPFLFCLCCGVSYGAHQASDYGKLGTLGSEGRSTATTIMSLSTMRSLRAETDLPPDARKLLSFTDNRQDASLQAGHFNDFVELVLLRSGLAAAVRNAGSSGIRHDELTHRVFDALGLSLSLYASNPNVEFLQREETERALRAVLGYYLYRDLRRGWRITSPNLEQCGLLAIDYLSLRQFCAANDRWASLHPVLAGASPDERERACRVLLDYMRRELAIRVDYLSAAHQETIEQQSRQYLVPPWSLDDMSSMERSTIVVPGSRSRDADPTDRLLFLSPRGGYGAFLRRHATFASWAGERLRIDDTDVLIRELLTALTVPGIVQRVLEPRGDLAAGYQVNASALVWRAGDGGQAFHDPVRVPSAPESGLRANPFFVDYYRADTSVLKAMEAREHTAQVPSSVREDREQRFRDARLPVLYCSPTMELGVDIASLNVVNMRNVPPTPANYAQRSGRAGRSGQPAFVLTYCSAGSPHDQYFFRRPDRMVSGAVTAPRLDLANEDLLRAHVHAVWLGVAKLGLGHSLAEVLDVGGDEPTLELQPKLKAALDDRRFRDLARERATDALGEAVTAVLAPSETVHGWMTRVLDQLPRSFDDACERWRSLYRAALTQSKRQQRRVLDASLHPRDREAAARLRAEAEAQIRLLLEVGEEQHSDFYSYRYFASEGFLPGYNFPRLPLSAFLPGRRGSQGRDEFLTRPRFLAITEFGPRSIVYHEGSRYVINKVIVPVDADGASINRRGVQCTSCGYLHPLGDEPAPDLCEHCGAALPGASDNLFRMQNVSTRRRDRINSDEEERFRLGYEMKTGLRFATRGGVVSAQEAELASADGIPLARLVYGNAATLWRINLGWRRRQNRDQTGFLLDLDRGYWAKNQEVEDDPDDDVSRRLARVVPFVEDQRNCLLVVPSTTLPAPVMASLQSALKSAVQIVYQLEDRELAAEPLPSDDVRSRILLYEASEGGAGVLRRLVEDPGAAAVVARAALDLCHFDADTLRDRRPPDAAGNGCEAACYDCLLSYYNQREHRLLDRKLLPELLRTWMLGKVRTSPRPEPRQEHVARLKRLAQSDLERSWIDLVDRQGLKLPSDGQVFIDAANARPDFLYRQEGAAIFVDGPVHDDERQRGSDREQQDALEDAGFAVIRFHHAVDWLGVIRGYPSVFGTVASIPPPGTHPPGPQVEGVDLEDFDPQWQSLVVALAGDPGALIRAVGDIADPSGRVVGSCPAEVVAGAKSVFVVDLTSPDVERVEAALLAEGRVVVRVDPAAGDAAERVRAALRNAVPS
ncbi:MAG: DEAD/DEAH box helicase [Deltaproteobacteria bacterium]|nr:DEAD/DEAH box helicase [Deltaproteobacteria bacterium]